MALGLVFGLLGALGLSFAREYMDHSIRTPEDVEEKLHLPTLASLPRVKHRGVRPSLRLEGLSYPVSRKIKAKAADGSLSKSLCEHYNTLSTSLLAGSREAPQHGHAIAVLSCHRAEGVSTLAANLAVALAQQGDAPVVLIDANYGHPSVHQIFGLRRAPGLTDALVAGSNGDNSGGRKRPAFCHRAQNLDILPAGSVYVASRKTFRPDAFAQLLELARRDYRFVVVDLPALSANAGAIHLAGTCDAAVMVVEAERLRWEVARHAEDQLRQARVSLLGVVLNKRRFPIPQWVYSSL